VVDYQSLYDVFYFPTFWNYPGAYKEGTAELRNITGVTSKARTNLQSPSLIFTLNPGNGLVDTIDITNTYMDTNDMTGSILFFIFPNWNPDDTAYRTIEYKNFNVSIWQPDNHTITYNTVTGGGQDGYLISNFTFSNFYFYGYKDVPVWPFYILCNPNDVFYYVNSKQDNWTVDINFITAIFWRQATFENLTFTNSIGMRNQNIASQFNQFTILKSILFENITGSDAPVFPLIHLGDLNLTQYVIDGLFAKNWNFKKSYFLSNTSPFNKITLLNVGITNSTISSGGSFVFLEGIDQFEFKNHSYDLLRNADGSGEGSAVIKISSINANNSHDITTIQVRYKI
jgi:hypothetical protein